VRTSFTGIAVELLNAVLTASVFLAIIPCFDMAAATATASASDLETAKDAASGDSITTPKFELDIMPMLTADGCNAGACHGKARGQNGFSLSLLGFDSDFDFAAIVNEARGRRLFPAQPDRSLILMKAAAELPHGGGVRWSTNGPKYQLFRRWIEAGMPRVTDQDPHLVRVTLSPEEHPLAIRGLEQLQVTAHYSDGSTRNVTTTSAFQSNEPAVVAVDGSGLLRAGDLPGEATIMARYMGQISTWSTAIPRADIPSPEQYAALPRNNFIDEFIWAKLQDLNILPSDPVDDAKFMRRVHLDLIGRLPTPDESRSFLGDSSANKREALVDQLLERPEYADFWANKWADLLRPNPYRVGIKASYSLDHWLREAFRANMPMDQFARELVTAKGSTWKNGAVTLFRDRRTPEETTTLICQLFLGTRLECAKCHQHPFEVFGQREFYGMAAYFARVGYKGTGLSPPISGSEEIIMSADKGEVRHPITNEVLPPTPLFGKPLETDNTDNDADRREAFAVWLTAEDNERFAEAAVNRIWGELFGIGLVDPVDDMRATNPPSNPALLHALANEYRRLGFNQKAFLKTLTSSYAYSLSSLPNETNTADTRNYSRHYRKLTKAEVLADAISDVTLIPDSFSGMPQGSRAIQAWTHRFESDFLDAFGRPDANQDPPCERLPQATMVQALHLMNAPAIQSKLADDQSMVARISADPFNPEQAIEHLYLAAYSRFPSSAELQSLLDILSSPDTQRRPFMEDLLWSLINTPEFVYED
jgi:hypothetical protein